MPYAPTEQERNIIRNSIKQRFPNSKEDAAADAVIDILTGNHKGKYPAATNRKQAEAVVANCTTYAEVLLLAKYGFAKLADNNAKTFKDAIAAAPAANAATAAAANVQQVQNDFVNGYLGKISGAYKAHMKGTAQTVPMYNGTQESAVRFNNGPFITNGPRKLPHHHSYFYIEWYPFDGTTRSPHKRFFTRKGEANTVWFTDGGTHGNLDNWYERVGANWNKMP